MQSTSQSFHHLSHPISLEQCLVEGVITISEFDLDKNCGIQQIFSTKAVYAVFAQVTCLQLCDSIEAMKQQIVHYFQDQFGFYVSKWINQGSFQAIRQKIALLVLYTCIYSVNKERYIEKIMSLPQKMQQRLVSSFQELQQELSEMKIDGKLIQLVNKLQTENDELRNLLQISRSQQQKYQKEIKNISEQLEETKIQRNQFVVEKRKILSNFSLSSLAEYEDLCKKLVQENQAFRLKQQQLISQIQQLEEQVSVLRKGIKNTDQVLLQLNMKNSVLIKDHEHLAREYQNSIMNQSRLFYQKQQKQSFDKEQAVDIVKSFDELRVSNIIRPENFFNNAFNSSNFSELARRSKRESRASARSIFQTTKDNVLLSQKVQKYQEQIEKLKFKMMELEVQIFKQQQKQKFNIKVNRKILKLTDQFMLNYGVSLLK